MREEKKNEHSIEEEMEWRIRVLRRTARTCAAEAKRLEREKGAVAKMDPLEDKEGLADVLRKVDEVVMRDEELDLYVWLVFHLETAWDYVPIQGVR